MRILAADTHPISTDWGEVAAASATGSSRTSTRGRPGAAWCVACTSTSRVGGERDRSPSSTACARSCPRLLRWRRLALLRGGGHRIVLDPAQAERSAAAHRRPAGVSTPGRRLRRVRRLGPAGRTLPETVRSCGMTFAPSKFTGTLELRAADSPTRVEDAGALAALVQCLAGWLGERFDGGERLPVHPSTRSRKTRGGRCATE